MGGAEGRSGRPAGEKSWRWPKGHATTTGGSGATHTCIPDERTAGGGGDGAPSYHEAKEGDAGGRTCGGSRRRCGWGRGG